MYFKHKCYKNAKAASTFLRSASQLEVLHPDKEFSWSFVISGILNGVFPGCWKLEIRAIGPTVKYIVLLSKLACVGTCLQVSCHICCALECRHLLRDSGAPPFIVSDSPRIVCM